MAAGHQGTRKRVTALVVAVVMIIAGVAAIIYLGSQDEQPSPAAQPPAAAEAQPALEGVAIPPGTVATWEWREGAPADYHADGLQLRLERVGGEEDYKARLFISGAGPAHEVALETAGPVTLAVGDFDRQATGSEVLVGAYSGGAHCCTQVQLIERAGDGWRAVDLGSWDGGGFEAPVDYDKDGTPEIERYDNRFLYAFESYAGSVAPPQFFNVKGGEVVEVSAAPGLKPQFEALLPEYRKGCEGVSNGACAGYVAAAARAGKLKEAWRVMMKSHDRTSDWGLPPGCAVEMVDDKCPPGQEITFTDFPAALGSFLTEWGYIAGTPSVLDLAKP